MELLVLVPIIGLLVVYIAYKEWLNIAYRQWQAELDLFKRRLAVYHGNLSFGEPRGPKVLNRTIAWEGEEPT